MTTLAAESVQAINATIAAAEAKTSAEIIPVLAPRSCAYRHVGPIAGVIGMALTLSVATIVHALSHREWLHAHIGYFVLVAVLGYAIGLVLARLEPIERWLAGDARFESCHNRARQVFIEAGVFKTQARVGTLIYVSWFERLVLVLGDESVSQKLDNADFAQIVKMMQAELARGDAAEAFEIGVKELGNLLAQHFPRSADDRNELPDRLLVLA